MGESVCAEFLKKFTSEDPSTNHEARVKFMLTNPTIRAKLDEWVEQGKPAMVDAHEEIQNTVVKNNFDLPESDCSLPTYQQATNVDSPAYRFEKNTKYSIQKREEGNVHFKQKKLYDSLQCYNEAIRFAQFPPAKNDLLSGENQDLSLSIAFANRSAVYFDMGQDFLHRSLADAELALKFDYPDNLQLKLFLRKATIYIKTKRFSSAEECLSKAKTLFRKYNKNTKNPSDVLKRVAKMEKEIIGELQPSTSSKCTRLLPHLCIDGSDCGDTVEIGSSFEENPKFESAASSIVMNFSKSTGRYATCSAALKEGDTVFQEKPFASVLIPEFYESYCHHCHDRLKDGFFVPCSGCTQVKFCGIECSENAWNRYHQHECLYLELLHSVGIAHLALRVVLVAGAEEVLEAMRPDTDTKLNDPSNTSVFAKDQPKYQRVYSLVDNSRAMYPEDMFQYTLTASLITNFLEKKTSFFELYKEEDRVKIGAAILRHICQLISNAHAITSIVSDFNSEKISLATVEESQMKIASAIYPSASMMNHSCSPNIISTFSQGNQLIVKVTEKLKRRGEIFNCYGPHYRRSGLKDRQEALRDQYFFSCDCTACKNESDEGFSFADQFRSLKCYKCDGPILPDEANETFLRECLHCKQFQNIREQLEISMQTDRTYTLGSTLLEEEKVQEAIKTLTTVYEGRKQILYKFNSELGEVCDTIGRCHTILGAFAEALPYVKESLNYTEARFGNPSIEYTHELAKYTELLELVKNPRYTSRSIMPATNSALAIPRKKKKPGLSSNSQHQQKGN